MAISMVCSTCGRRDTLTATDPAGWVESASGQTCPRCVEFPDPGDDRAFFQLDGALDRSFEGGGS